MRKLPLLLVLLLLSVLLAAATAQASLLPGTEPPPSFLAEPEEEEEAEEDESEEEAEDAAEEAEIEREICEEDPELCEEEPGNGEGKGKRKDNPCLLKKASARLTANPGKRRLRLTVRYKTTKPATVNVEASLRGPKGIVFLGNEHSRFRRSGVYRDTFELPEKKMKKALAANQFTVELQAVNTPASCGLELTGASRRSKR